MESSTKVAAEVPSPADDGMGRLPDGLIDKYRVVEVPGQPPITVQKWSVMKLLAITTYISEASKGFSQEDMDKLSKGKIGEIVSTFAKHFPEKLVGIVELSVSDGDKTRIRNLDGEVFLDVAEAVVEMNVTKKFLGKVRTLGAAFVAKWKESGTR